jgi:hypothetical protein
VRFAWKIATVHRLASGRAEKYTAKKLKGDFQ